MIKLVITNEKNLELYELEKVHVGENKFGYYLIFLPEVLNGYNLSNCEVKLIQIFEDNTSVAIDVDTTQEVRPIKEFITLDATAQAQTVTLSVLITHDGDVIGKTNQKSYQVYPTKNATPIDPREELDEIIAELRAENADLEATVSEQAAEINEKDTQITELNNQVEDLTEENTEQAETIERQETTIDQLNSRVPKMYTPPEPIIPESETRVYTPPQNYDGFASFTVKGNKYLNVDLQKFLARDIDFDLEIQANIVGDFLCYQQIGLISCRLTNCTILGNSAFRYCSGLQQIELPSSLQRIDNYCFSDCISLQKINIPHNITYLGVNPFANCNKLQIVTIGTGFNCNSLNLSVSTLYSHDTILSWFNALADRTGQTAYTLTIGTTNLNKMTAEEKAIATNKNWNLA